MSDIVIEKRTGADEETTRDPLRVREMFDRISARYDLANHLLSCGADVLWRARAARIVARWQPSAVLDVATGTGDLALAIQNRLPAVKIIGTDFSPEMLGLARAKGLHETQVADALELPFASGLFDVVTVAFGLRNMWDWAAALREMRRVLTDKGHLLILDFSQPRRFLRPVYRTYLHRLLPAAAALVTGEAAAYAYLGESIEAFPSGTAMLALLGENGFAAATAQPLTGGIATIYTAAARH